MFNLIGAYIIIVFLFKFYQERKSLVIRLRRLDPLSIWARGLLTAVGLLYIIIESGVLDSKELGYYNFPYFLFTGFNLWVHEAGHIFFLPFGSLFHHLGGSMNEVIFPSLLFWWSRKHRLHASACFAIYWLGFNLISISHYMGDARARVLPLIGGGAEGHDWHNSLEILGLLEYDTVLSKLTSLLGLFIAGYSFFKLWQSLLENKPGT
jgi:hypothetical protein